MLLEQLVDKGSNHLVSLFANKLTFYLIKVSSLGVIFTLCTAELT